MKLRVISNYGEEENIITNQATPEIVKKTIVGLNWSGFHQVVLTKSNGDWLEVGGSLDPSDGLSIMYEEGGKQVVIKEAPKNIDLLIKISTTYAGNSDEWKDMADWD